MNNSKNKINISFGGTLLQATLYEDGTLIGYENSGKGEFLSTNAIIYSYGGRSPGGSLNNIITGEKK